MRLSKLSVKSIFILSLLQKTIRFARLIFREVKLIQKSLKQLQAESNKRDMKLYANMFVHTTKDPSVAKKVSCLGSSLI